MHKYTFLLPLLLVFTFSCNAHATRSASLVMPLSASGDATFTDVDGDDSPEQAIDYTGVGFRYEERTDDVGIGVEFTPSANYDFTESDSNSEASGTEVGVFARKYWPIGRSMGSSIHSRGGQALIFIEAGTIFGLGMDLSADGYADESSSAYTNLRLAIGSRMAFNGSMFAEIGAGFTQAISPATFTLNDGFGTLDYDVDLSTSTFGINVGLGMNF